MLAAMAMNASGKPICVILPAAMNREPTLEELAEQKRRNKAIAISI
jgi:hypothetical protein